MAHILIIEDDAQFSEMLQQMQKNDGHQVASASDGAAALQVLTQMRPDLIITDMLMPNMDGVEVIMRLQQDGNPTPVIAMSGGRRSVSAEFNLESASMLGVRATLPKPFARADLRTAITAALA